MTFKNGDNKMDQYTEQWKGFNGRLKKKQSPEEEGKLKGACYKKKGMLTVSLDYDGGRRRRERKNWL